MAKKLIKGDIDAGGGATVDLYYDPDTDMVTEEKTLSDGSKHEVTFPLDDFEEELYGDAGEEFIDEVFKTTYDETEVK
jgi:hypothetical protein